MPGSTSAGQTPRVTLLVRNSNDAFAIDLTLASLSIDYQLGVDAEEYEVLVVASPSDDVVERRSVGGRPGPRWITAKERESWISAGLREAKGNLVCLAGSPGAASSTMVSTLCTVLDGYDCPLVSIRTLTKEGAPSSGAVEWLRSHGPPVASSLIRDANPHLEWLDPNSDPENVAVPRESLDAVAREAVTQGRPLEQIRDLFAAWTGERVQLVGDAFVRSAPGARDAVAQRTETRSVDPDLSYFGLVVRPEIDARPRAGRFALGKRPLLSVVIVAYDMGREVPRTLMSLLPPYQRGVTTDEYEIVVIENGSNTPLTEHDLVALGPNVAYHYLEDAPTSPARAINVGVERSRGDAIAIMIDGACLLSPGVLSGALFAWRMFPSPIVATRYFVLGSGLQRDAAARGYDAGVEDGLLRDIDWPREGYRLFEISSPLTDAGTSEHWLSGWFESNCLFMPRRVFERIGGCDERFDLPGGGGLIVDVFRQACEFPGAQPVQLVGEGVFHQIHGGVTSNTTAEDVARKKQRYVEQYRALRERDVGAPDTNFYFTGKLRVPAARWKMRG